MIEKFTIYLGLNDQTTKRQEIETVNAYKIVSNMIGYFFLVACVLLVSVPFPLCSFIPALVPVVPGLVCGGIISGAVGAVLICQ